MHCQICSTAFSLGLLTSAPQSQGHLSHREHRLAGTFCCIRRKPSNRFYWGTIGAGHKALPWPCSRNGSQSLRKVCPWILQSSGNTRFEITMGSVSPVMKQLGHVTSDRVKFRPGLSKAGALELLNLKYKLCNKDR